MKKRILAVFLTLCMVLSLLPAGVLADDAPTNGTCGENLTWTLSGGTLTISGTGAMREYGLEQGYGRQRVPWYERCTGIRKVVLQTGVTTVGSCAFAYCVNLTDVTIPEGVVAIGSSAFYECKKLENIVLPNSITDIGSSAFYNCSRLKNVNIPQGVTVIRESLFYFCSWMQSVTIPDSVTTIESYAFLGSGLTDVTIPEGVTDICVDAFASCECLTEVILPASAVNIEMDAFSDCASLKKLQVSEENPNYSAQDGILYNKEKTKLLAWPSAKGTVTVPDHVTTIGERAFVYCRNLTDVTIPESVTSIEFDAFHVCGLATLTIPGTVTDIGAGAFSFCEGLYSVTLCDGVTGIGDDMFCGCGSLTSITIPASVASVGEYAFSGCEALKDIYFGGSEEDWANIEIGEENEALANATIHYNAEMPKPPTPPVTDPCASGHKWDDGKITKQPTAKEKGMKTYTCTICGEMRTEELPAIGGTVTFADVPSGEYYYDAVNWAISKGITNGTSETTFSPDDPCTRAQAVTFLWRAAGHPEPKSTSNPFADVPADQYYYKAVLWAVEQGITNGISATEFGPDAICNRAQIVTFLYRCEGTPDAEGSGFNDVPAGEYYYAPVIWAVSKGVTNGTGDGNFSPMDDCTRAHIVTFLYRDMVK